MTQFLPLGTYPKSKIFFFHKKKMITQFLPVGTYPMGKIFFFTKKKKRGHTIFATWYVSCKYVIFFLRKRKKNVSLDTVPLPKLSMKFQLKFCEIYSKIS